MKSKAEIDEKWIKASIIGTIWAASEIVLGSFLHNLKVPFSGNILTAIGIIILISVSYIWREKGLFWRAGLICAIMKTMSPSAVIFGPMIAIFSEAMLLEISVRLLGKTLPGFFLGSILAMSWNLFQKLVNLIIFYGFNIVELYKNLIQYAQKQLNIHSDIFWLPLIILAVIYALLGLLSAIIGIRVGRKILNQPVELQPKTYSNTFSQNNKAKQNFDYSLVWLFADIILIIGGLVLLNYAGIIYWSIAVTGIATIWVFRYKRALRQLSKPKFWVYFVLITMLSAFVFTRVQSESLQKGLLIGLQMNFRAVLIIVGFSVLGTELYNPGIRNFFMNTYFKQLPLALELSFESLPSMISNIPDFKTIARNPVSIISQLISQVDFRLAELKAKINFKQKVFIIAGSVGQGKTTFLINVLSELKNWDIKTGGFYSPRLMENNETTGYDIVDISTGEREGFLRKTEDPGLKSIGKYQLFQDGLNKGITALKESNNLNSSIVVIDEIGNLELEGKGWASSLDALIHASDHHILMVVRENFVEKVVARWHLKQSNVLNISQINYLEASHLISEHIC